MEAFAKALVESRLNRVREELGRAFTDPAVDPIHDLRVSIRRLQQAMRLFCPHDPRHFRPRLRPVLKAAGEVRNQDIAIDLVNVAEAAIGPTINAAQLRQRFDRRRAIATGIVRLRIAEAGTVDTSGLRIAEESAAAMARPTLGPLAQSYLVAGDSASHPDCTWDQIHQFRLVSKQFRYSLEIFNEFYDEGIEERIAALRRVQNVLGEGNDCETTAGLPPSESSPAFLEWLRHRQKKREQEFREIWTAQFSGRDDYWVEFLG